MSQKRLRFLLALSFGLVIANILFLEFVTRPKARRVLNEKQLEQDRRDASVAGKKEYDDLVARKAALDATLSDVAYFFDHLVMGEKDGQENVRRAIQKMADDAGISIKAIGYSIETKGPRSLETMSLSFQVTGTYEQVRQFLSGIEHADVFLMVDSVDLSSAGDKEDDVTLNIRLSTLFKRPA